MILSCSGVSVISRKLWILDKHAVSCILYQLLDNFEELHSVFTARFNLTLAAARLLIKCCILAAYIYAGTALDPYFVRYKYHTLQLRD